jgi:energy-coupling factor transport system substrate-specific component
VSWELASFLVLGAGLLAGFAWYERSRPTSQVVALVAALAALAIAGRIAFAAFPNVKPTTDIVIFAGYALGPAPGFAVGGFTALVSNFWFGQGPWTPWQMAGWGLCGILGAALAVVRPTAGRFTLAAVCGLAGIAYGALLNFSLMATYGGDLSLQRFLALESRAIPFDAAHAIGNATLALLAGPAIVRMLVRFRERFEWRTPAVASVLLLALAFLSALPASDARASEASRAADWLVAAQNEDGGWGSSPEDASAPDMTAWAMLGLEAAGRNPLDIARGGRGPVAYLRANVGALGSPGDYARTILALHGAGVDPRSFGGHDLVVALAAQRRDNGSFEGWPNSTAFSIMALRVGGGGVEQSISWLLGAQNGDGGWGDLPGPPSTPEGTAAVMQAIPTTSAAQRGLGYLRRTQRPSGGFPLGGSGAVNSQATAWAVQGMLAAGVDPASVREGGKSALDYLAARQDADGHYRYSPSSDQTPVWVTSQVLAAVAGDSFPVPPVAREPKPAAAPGADPAGALAPPAPAVPVAPSAGGAAEGLESSGGQAVPPSTGGVPSAPLPGTGAVPAPPSGVAPEGEEPEAVPRAAAPAFQAGDNPGPEPWAPLGVGLGTGGLALGGVLFFGRRFGW